MRKCCACREYKDLFDFNKNKTRKDGINNVCRSCNKVRAKQYYSENKEKHKKATKQRKVEQVARNQKYILEYLSTHFCIICNESDPVVLDFDHLFDKVKAISHMVGQGLALTTIQKEIAKCQVLCANCHRRKTAKEQGWYSLSRETR